MFKVPQALMTSILSILCRPFGLLAPKTYIYYLALFPILRVHDQGNPRNAPYALKLVSMVLFLLFRNVDISWKLI